MENEIGQLVGPDRSARSDSDPRRKSSLFSLPHSRILIAGGVVLLIEVALLLARGPGSQVFKIYLTEPGAYRVTYENLQEAGLKAGRIGSEGLALTPKGDEVPEVPAELVKVETVNFLELKIPRRQLSTSTDPLIDMVLLNWIEIVHHEDTSLYDFYPQPQESVFFAAKTEASLLSPVAIELDRPSHLKSSSRQADYIIITHPRLLQAIEPLAAFHRRRGLKVDVVAVDDVYDEFNHSIVHPDAIRDFLKFAYHEWQRPAPRFVLLAGDASWDAEGIGSVYKGGAPYSPDLPLSHRNLTPTLAFEEGFSGRAIVDWLDGEKKVVHS